MLLQHSGQHKDKVIKWAVEDVNGHEEEKSKEFQSVAAKRDADDNEKQWMKHFTYGCQELMHSNELMPTPFMLLYINPITTELQVLGSHERKDFAHKNPRIMTQFEYYVTMTERSKLRLTSTLRRQYANC